MTDILTKLAALTQLLHGLQPCPRCGAARDTLTAHGFGNYSVQCFDCGLQTRQQRGQEAAVNAWNIRPREAALIALVQEAVVEIERLEVALGKIASQHYEHHSQAIAAKALNPQEPTR